MRRGFFNSFSFPSATYILWDLQKPRKPFQKALILRFWPDFPENYEKMLLQKVPLLQTRLLNVQSKQRKHKFCINYKVVICLIKTNALISHWGRYYQSCSVFEFFSPPFNEKYISIESITYCSYHATLVFSRKNRVSEQFDSLLF